MYSTSGVEVKTGQTGGKYLSVGINDDVRIVDITDGASASGKEFLRLTVSKGDADTGQNFDLYMSPAAQDKSIEKLVHMLVDGAGVDRTALDGVKAETLTAYAAELHKLVKNSPAFRLKITGEEYMKSGEVKVGKRLGLPPFAEAAGKNGLKFDENNSYDVSRMPAADAAPTGGGMPVAADDPSNKLPF